ncbi:MAG: hypothetical protein WC292_00070 [Clostridia bacterium]
MVYQKEFNAALEEAERINDSEFKGKLSGNGGMLVRERKDYLQFRFWFERDDSGGLADSRPKSQEQIIDMSGIKLFSGVINSRYKKDSESRLVIEVFVVNNAVYDKQAKEMDRAERLKILRGGN